MYKILLTIVRLSFIGIVVACSSKGSNPDISNTPLQVEKVSDSILTEVDQINGDEWDLSPMFVHSVVYEDGTTGSYTLVGNKEHIGFTGPFPIVEKEPQKYFWFYLGHETIWNKKVEVRALKKGSYEHEFLFSGFFYEGAEVSPGSVNMPSNITFPSKGIWRIQIYLNDVLVESIVVEVKSSP
ncbi:hypothetical protein Q75_09150 [Bacillus coahuilensis p1.1.43]|uniref:DUF4871 domain-containing protein n=1 Tax=Bacillus coahuilensis p1.1.43 TaxID=1150625 RepID=A0A147K806_9BACI|nr:hypothetical protein [Bacillus coahuilensis]KUP06295.1 hypothetical protein Q75_09150 [Bacillus coahuilensis p1.1.43]